MTSMANHHQQRTTDSLQQQQLEQGSPISLLPEGSIADIISRTTPRDACRLALFSKIFRSAAESDVVWERFLPPDYQTIISKSSPWPPSSLLCLLSTSSLPGLPCTFPLLGLPYRFPLLSLPSKKSLFLSLCDQPIFIDDGKNAFFLDKQSGKICYMISSRTLCLWGVILPHIWDGLLFPAQGS
ncbi:F-box protein At2g02240-like [Mangifera indica]|uniref:F-box protein At2g02240-like n=1 Tax=Mangifera indica TaxID=29780 RepID=UPI001CF9ADAD|nr:F-box protein At2g02240-like [Mangifera indica]